MSQPLTKQDSAEVFFSPSLRADSQAPVSFIPSGLIHMWMSLKANTTEQTTSATTSERATHSGTDLSSSSPCRDSSSGPVGSARRWSQTTRTAAHPAPPRPLEQTPAWSLSDRADAASGRVWSGPILLLLHLLQLVFLQLSVPHTGDSLSWLIAGKGEGRGGVVEWQRAGIIRHHHHPHSPITPTGPREGTQALKDDTTPLPVGKLAGVNEPEEESNKLVSPSRRCSPKQIQTLASSRGTLMK